MQKNQAAAEILRLPKRFDISDYVRSEGSSGYFGKLLELLAKRVEDDGNSENKSENPVDKACNKSAENEPKKVTEEAGTEISVNRLAHRPHIEFCYLKALFTKGNSYKSYAPDNAREEPKRRADTAKGEEPQNISYKFHSRYLRSIFLDKIFIRSNYIINNILLSTKNEKIFLYFCRFTRYTKECARENRTF